MTTRENYAPLRQKYEVDGYVVARGVLDAGLVAEMVEHVAWLSRKYPDVRPEKYDYWMVARDPFWVRVVSDPRLLDIAEAFIGPNIGLFASHYIAKPPRDGQPVLMHQDGAYWPLQPMEVVTLWVAVDDSTPENGCLRVLPGTQNHEFHELRERTDVANVLSSGIDEALVDESKLVDVVLKAGDVSIHHPNIIHGSNANTSDRWRRGLTIRYIPTSTRIMSEKPWPCAFLLRGEGVPGVNEWQPFPKYTAGEHMPFRGCEAWA